MIDISPEHIVRERRSSTGRFLLLTSTDLPAGHPLLWCGATLDTGSDAFGMGVRLDGNGDAWTAGDLLHVALARAAAEEDRRLAPLAVDTRRHLEAAVTAWERHGKGRQVPLLLPGVTPSPYPWTDAVRSGHVLPLCPDPVGNDEGVTPELLLMLIVELLGDGAVAFPADRPLKAALNHARLALDTEVRRVAVLNT
jgi:hypothetical protein